MGANVCLALSSYTADLLASERPHVWLAERMKMRSILAHLLIRHISQICSAQRQHPIALTRVSSDGSWLVWNCQLIFSTTCSSSVCRPQLRGKLRANEKFADVRVSRIHQASAHLVVDTGLASGC